MLGVISWQVAQEFLSLATKKFKSVLKEADVESVVEDLLQPLWRVQPSPDLFLKAARLHSVYGYSLYDSLIVAAALFAECNILYSEDFQSGQVIDGLRIENPF